MKNRLSVLVSLLTVLFTTGVYAHVKAAPTAPPEFVGTYTLKAQGINLLSAKHELTVFLQNQAAHDYVSNLRSQNYACQNVDGRHVKCARFIKDLQSIGSPFKNVYDKYMDEKLEIFASNYPAELVNDAEYLTEWKKSQNAKWMGLKLTELRYSIIKDPILPENLVKMKFTNGDDQRAYFYVVGHFGRTEIAFQHKEVLKLSSAHVFVISETMNCLLEIYLTQ